MASTKSSPLETYLNTVAPVGTESSEKDAPAESKSMDKDWEEGAHAVILTILSNHSVLSDSQLRERSEFPPDLYRHVVAKLAGAGLLSTADGHYHLTDQGRVAAKRQRERLMGL
jgi:hypothetical protein